MSEDKRVAYWPVMRRACEERTKEVELRRRGGGPICADISRRSCTGHYV